MMQIYRITSNSEYRIKISVTTCTSQSIILQVGNKRNDI